MANKSIKLYDGGNEVAYYTDAEIVQFPERGYPLMFKVKVEADKKVVTRTFTTTLPSIIEERIEHSGLISV